MVVTLETV